MATRKVDAVNNFWKALAITRRRSSAPGRHQAAHGAGALDALTK
jgi:hypothetical protein